MREIKFRAWDKENRIMRFAAMGKTSGEFSPESGLINLEYMFEWDDVYPIMQFTGLKDKNGKRIYEGDIIFPDYWDKRAIVKWNDSVTGFYPFNMGDYSVCSDELEVIGNIFENPELLKTS